MREEKKGEEGEGRQCEDGREETKGRGGRKGKKDEDNKRKGRRMG